MKKERLLKAVALFCVLAMLLPLVMYYRVKAVENRNGLDLDVVFVIDDSASMNDSDPDRIAKEACRLF